MMVLTFVLDQSNWSSCVFWKKTQSCQNLQNTSRSSVIIMHRYIELQKIQEVLLLTETMLNNASNTALILLMTVEVNGLQFTSCSL